MGRSAWLAGAIGLVSADAFGDAFDLFHIERRLALGSIPRKQRGLDLDGVHAYLTKVANVALAFMKERGCVEVRRRRTYPASGWLYEDAMIEFMHLAECPQAD